MITNILKITFPQPLFWFVARMFVLNIKLCPIVPHFFNLKNWWGNTPLFQSLHYWKFTNSFGSHGFSYMTNYQACLWIRFHSWFYMKGFVFLKLFMQRYPVQDIKALLTSHKRYNYVISAVMKWYTIWYDICALMSWCLSFVPIAFPSLKSTCPLYASIIITTKIVFLLKCWIGNRQPWKLNIGLIILLVFK